MFDVSSLKYNKADHINSYLRNNLSLKEIKELNKAGFKYELSKYLKDNHIPCNELLGNLGSILFCDSINEEDDIYITDQLSQSSNPIVIYSCGSNDLMFRANTNPSSLQKYDKTGSLTEEYLYAESVMNNEKELDKIINKIENNFKNILKLNPNTKIYTLSIYVPKKINNEDYDIFINAINMYNKKLEELCNKYNATYIDEQELGTVYNDSNFNFHINEIGHKELTKIIIDKMAREQDFENKPYDKYYLKHQGLKGFYKDLINILDNYDYANNYDVAEDQYDNKLSDMKVCQKVLVKYKKNIRK